MRDSKVGLGPFPFSKGGPLAGPSVCNTSSTTLSTCSSQSSCCQSIKTWFSVAHAPLSRDVRLSSSSLSSCDRPDVPGMPSLQDLMAGNRYQICYWRQEAEYRRDRSVCRLTSLISIHVVIVLHPDASKEIAEIHGLSVMPRPCLLIC